MIRFLQSILPLSLGIRVVGVLTLVVARIRALFESDAKKIVALSTLRQLGLIFLALGIGNSILCLFHVITHALAKANLFLVVGTYLHAKYSQQDSRRLAPGQASFILIIGGIIRVLRLIGFIFLRGFYSKEQILFKTYSLLSRLLLMILLVGISSLTLVYCVRLLYFLVVSNKTRIINDFPKRNSHSFPVIVLRSLSLVGGCVLAANLFELSSLKHSSPDGYY